MTNTSFAHRQTVHETHVYDVQVEYNMGVGLVPTVTPPHS